MFSISVCMIVKDEEPTLDRILECALKFADEIIVVDTGSSDKSIDIARKYTDNVYNYEWCDDFSKARNYSIDLATSDYFMWLDADDYITDEEITKINKLKYTGTNTDVFMFKYSVGTFEFFRERLLKNNGKFKFNGAVHEAITPSGKIEYLDIVIEHRKVKVNNPTRNIDIYEKLIKNGVTLSARDQYYYGRELYYIGKFSKSIKVLKKYLTLDSLYQPDEIGASIIISDNYFNMKKYNKSIESLMQCILKFTPTAEICCKLAQSFEATSNISSAIFWYKSATIAERYEMGFVNTEYYDIIPYIELTRLLYHTNYQKSKHYHTLAKSINPHHPSVIYNEQFFQT